MANPEHLATLKQGVKAWNHWRTKNPGIVPHLREATINHVDMKWIDLRRAYLSNARKLGSHIAL